jgi:predicted carbohydrate-binding protein with CBM5 and CBM33 domain
MGVISDEVIIPKDLAPGDYVLSWRWDAEETAQIWSNCADVTIVAAK